MNLPTQNCSTHIWLPEKEKKMLKQFFNTRVSSNILVKKYISISLIEQFGDMLLHITTRRWQKLRD